MLVHPGAAALSANALENVSPLNMDVMNSNGISANSYLERYPMFILDCYAPWCEPCLAMNAVLSELSGELGGQVAFGMIDAENNTNIKMKYNITAYPTLLFFKNGRLVDKQIGYWSKPTFVRMLKDLEPSLDVSRVNFPEQYQPAVPPGMISSLGSVMNESGLPMLINDSNMQFTVSTYPLFVLDCFETECDFCSAMNFTVSRLSSDLKGRVTFGMINLPRNNETMERYNITAYPTLLIFREGTLISTQVGYQSAPALMGVLRRLDPSLDTRHVDLGTRNYQRPLHSG